MRNDPSETTVQVKAKLEEFLNRRLALSMQYSPTHDSVTLWLSCPNCRAFWSKRKEFDGRIFRESNVESIAIVMQGAQKLDGCECPVERIDPGKLDKIAMVNGFLADGKLRIDSPVDYMLRNSPRSEPDPPRYVVMRAGEAHRDARVAMFGPGDYYQRRALERSADLLSRTAKDESLWWGLTTMYSADSWLIVDMYSECYRKGLPEMYRGAESVNPNDHCQAAKAFADGAKQAGEAAEELGGYKSAFAALGKAMKPSVVDNIADLYRGADTRQKRGTPLPDAPLTWPDGSPVCGIETPPGRAQLGPLDQIVDGMEVRELMRRASEYQHFESSHPSMHSNRGQTLPQIAACSSEWSRQLREKVKAAEEEDRQREARRCGWDPGSEEEL